MTDKTNDWKPINTLPEEGHFLLAIYAPTSWTYVVHSARFHHEDSPKLRRMRLTHARAWMDAPEQPSQDINDG